MADYIELSVVLPAFHEGRSLATLIPKLFQALGEISCSFEILVVDTQEDLDDTSDVCRRYGVIHLHRRGGDRYGDAVRTGIAQARGRYVLFMDADGSHSPESIGAMWLQRHDFAIVIGSRYIAGGRTENSAVLVAMSHLLCLAVRLIFKIPLLDVTTSFRLYDANVLRTLDLQANGFDILQEILVKALTAQHVVRAIEVPVTFTSRTFGRSKRNLLTLSVAYVLTFVKLKIGMRMAAPGARST